MLVAISGSQGSGKSTTIQALADMGHNVIERKTSRSILEEWGVTLQEVNNNSELTIKFQEEISKRKYLDEKQASCSEDLWFTERTHSDLFTYALVSLGKDNNYNDWLESYYTKCLHYNNVYQNVFYLRAGLFDVVADGTRGAGKHYSRMVDLTMLDLTDEMVQSSKLSIIETADLDERVSIIDTTTNRHMKYDR